MKIVIDQFWKNTERWLVRLAKSLKSTGEFFLLSFFCFSFLGWEPATLLKNELFYRDFLRILPTLNAHLKHFCMSASEFTQILQERCSDFFGTNALKIPYGGVYFYKLCKLEKVFKISQKAFIDHLLFTMLLIDC